MNTSTQGPAYISETPDWVATIRGELSDLSGSHDIEPGLVAPARHAPAPNARHDIAPNDMEIALSARNVLQWTTYLPKDTFCVRVEAGWVTLSGDVDWEYQRHAALRAVCNLNGVTGVSDQIAIKPAACLSVVRSDIEAAMRRRAQAQA